MHGLSTRTIHRRAGRSARLFPGPNFSADAVPNCETNCNTKRQPNRSAIAGTNEESDTDTHSRTNGCTDCLSNR